MRHPPHLCRMHARSAVLLLALAGLAPLGCERDLESKKAIEAASIELASLDTGLGNAATVDRRERVYNTVVTSLKNASDSDFAAYASSANILLAKAHTGLAETPAATSAAFEAESLNRARVIRADLAQWLEMNAVADAADSYDPASELTALEAQIGQIQDAVAGLTKTRADVAGRHAALEKDVADLGARSKALRDEIGSLRVSSTSLSATEAAAVSEQIRERSRAADALELQAAEITARANPLVPQISEIDLNIAGLNNQIESLRAAQAAAQQRATDAKTEATEARALAAIASTRLNEEAEALISLRDGDLARAYEASQRELSTAAGAARKAANDNRSGSKLAEGVALQQSADLTWQLAQGLHEHALLLTALAEATPDLPRSGAYECAAAAATAARGEALAKAAETYEQAKSALTSAGARGEAGERLEKVGRMLDLIIQATQGQKVDWSAANRPAPSEGDEAASSDDGSTGEAGDDSSELSGTLQNWIEQIKGGDASFLAGAVYSDIPAINSMVSSAGDLIVKGQRLDALCKEKFGQSLTEFGAEQAGAGAMPGMGGMPNLDDVSVDSFDIQVSGETAEVRAKDAPGEDALKFRLVDGAWKIDLSEAALPPGAVEIVPMLDQFVPIVPKLAAVIDDLISETESGAYTSTQAVYIAQQQKMMPIMMEVMGSMQPPPGGG